MAQIIDGRKIAAATREQLKEKIVEDGLTPGLAVVLVGTDPASHLYVKLKEKACRAAGIKFVKHLFFYNTPQTEIIKKIQELNGQKEVHGIVVQLPLPKGIDQNEVIAGIDPKKDVDGFHPDNLKQLLDNKDGMIPVLVQSILRLITSTKVELAGKIIVVLAKSETFSLPLKYLLEKERAVVSVRKPADDFIREIQKADLLITAVGQPQFIKAEMIKEGAIIIDVGINRTEEGKVVGDVDFESVVKKASFITPVPGGVGPVTVATLLENTYLAAKRLKEL